MHTQRERHNAEVNNFETAINTFSNCIYKICTKHCYPKQIYNVTFNAAALPYLPTELSNKTRLKLCSCCRTHVMSIKTSPSKTFWNNLDPGVIPEALQNLTECE